MEENPESMTGRGMYKYLLGENIIKNTKIIYIEQCEKNNIDEENILIKPVFREKLYGIIAKKLKFDKYIIEEIKKDMFINIKKTEENKKYKILIAEDNPTNQKMILKIFEKMGFVNCDIASNGEEAVRLFENNHYNMVFMDCQMPVMSGFEAVEMIRKHEKGKDIRIPIIAITASALEKSREKCIASGMDDYISKPFHFEKLKKIILKWLFDSNKNKNILEEKTYKIKNNIDRIEIIKEISLKANINIEYAEKMFNEFIDDFYHIEKDFESDFKENSFEGLEIKAHTLKGTLLNLCINEAAEEATELEKEIDRKNRKEILKKFQNIREIIKKIK